ADTERAVEILTRYQSTLRSPEEQELKASIGKVSHIFQSELFQALLDIHEFYDFTLRSAPVQSPSLDAHHGTARQQLGASEPSSTVTPREPQNLPEHHLRGFLDTLLKLAPVKRSAPKLNLNKTGRIPAPAWKSAPISFSSAQSSHYCSKMPTAASKCWVLCLPCQTQAWAHQCRCPHHLVYQQSHPQLPKCHYSLKQAGEVQNVDAPDQPALAILLDLISSLLKHFSLTALVLCFCASSLSECPCPCLPPSQDRVTGDVSGAG
ncbi:Disks large 1, partial [Lamprotornis superbus]